MKYQGNKTKEISFPLGGIGTGSIGLAGDGRLIDWEIFNRPSKGSINGYSHFAIRAIDDDIIVPAVLNGDILKDYVGQYSKARFTGYGFGPEGKKMCGFPHFKNLVFDGEFPVANIDFTDDNFPGNVRMTAFNPFIPRDAFNSSIPGAFFEFEITNTTDRDMTYQLAFTVANPYEVSLNKAHTKDGFQFISLYNAGKEKDTIDYGDLTIGTDCKNTQVQTYWYRGEWQDAIISYWNDFSGERILKDRCYEGAGSYDIATLASEVVVPSKGKERVRFILTWSTPLNYNYWDEYRDETGNHKTWKNYYATVFEDSVASAVYSLKNWNDLYSRTISFKNILYSTTIPSEALDAAGSNLSVLKSPTVLRLEDGTFYGWEGVHEGAGSCEGTCQHVWNYAYAMCYLFPELERSIRNAEFTYSTAPDGRMGFRLQLPLGRKMTDYRPCVDGQMGAVIKCYREWKISGDNGWLKDNWDNIKKVLEYAWSESNYDRWDYDKDGVLEGRQHHTLDKELFGPSSWLQGMYLAALKAASEMAEFLGDISKAREYFEIYKKGRKWTKENLFNGEYFIHKTDISDKSIPESFNACDTYWNDETNEIKYQVSEGSSIDQLLGQWHADLVGLGDIFDVKQMDTALSAMMKYNFKESMRRFANPWRIFSVNDEAGSVICVYPHGAQKPKIPIPYCEETMTGFEYSFAGLLLSRGKIEEGIKVIKAVRDRFDGEKRNPWNEFECGNNYARSMASFAFIPILSGFDYHMPEGHIGFNPYKEEYKTLWSLESAWGSFETRGNRAILNIIEGNLTLKSFGLKKYKTVSSVKIDGKDIDFEFKKGIIYFKETKISESVEISK